MGWRLILLFCSLTSLASAQPLSFGDFTYEINAGSDPVSVTITDYPTTATGPVVIPESIEGLPVTAIGLQAFALCAGITSVTIPSGVTNIGVQAFQSCSALAAVEIPSSVTSIEFGAFNLCIALTSVTLPAGVTILTDSIFENCSRLTSVTILGSVTTIRNNAFLGCSGLASFTIPSTVTILGTSAFRFCTGLTTMDIPSGVTTIPFGLFSDCTNLVSVTLPSNLTSIGGSAFAKCSKLTGISAPGAAMVPPSIVLPSSVTGLGTFAFLECSAVTSVVIPNGVPSIGTSAFELCTSLTTISIPSSVTAIGNDAFRSCSSLLGLEITSSSSTTLGTNVFEGTTAMTSITVNPANPSFSSEDGVLFNKSKGRLLVYPRGRVGPYTIPATVTSIRAEAFRFAVGLTSVRIPSSVTEYFTEAFLGNSSLTSFTVDPGCPRFQSGTGSLYSATGLSLVAFPGGIGGGVVIPSTVTTISVSAFRSNNLLTSVTLPSGIVTVNNTAFADCAQLISATFEGNAPQTFGTNVFLSAAAGFTVYFNSTALSATFPAWQGYRSRVIGTNASLFNWLLDYNLPINSNLKSDDNGDGVSLLMAYALNLNPGQNLSGRIPQPEFPAEEMRMSFYAGAAGVTYVVEVSPDLVNWSEEGVSYSNLNQIRTATASRTPGSRFMRLSATY